METKAFRALEILLENYPEGLSLENLQEKSGLPRGRLKEVLQALIEVGVLQREKKDNKKVYFLLDSSIEGMKKALESLRLLQAEWEADEEKEYTQQIIDTGSLSRYLDHVVFLEEIASIILKSRNFQDVFRETFRRLFTAVDYDLGVAVFVESMLRFHIIQKEGLNPPAVKSAIQSTRELLRLVVSLPFIPHEAEIVDHIVEREKAGGTRLIHRIGAPFQRDSMTPGILALFRTTSHPFLADEKQLLDVLASQMSLACQNIHAMEKVRQLALTDDLTGIYNKRYFRLIYRREFERAKRYQFPLSLAMMDLDHFKRINDLYGHHQGDVVLSEFAAQVLSAIRSTDVFARYGGEEFVLLLPHTPEADAYQLSEKIRGIIDRYPFPGEESPLHCTVSLGVASLSQDINMPDELIQRADEYLYMAKKSGRNRVIATPIV